MEAVKSFKYPFKQIVRNAQLTFETIFSTNRHPLIPLCDQPIHFAVRTSTHFLIGVSPRTNVEPNLSDLKLNRLARFPQLESVKQYF